MGEFAIRRDRGFSVPRYQGAGKAERTAGGGQSQRVSKAAVDTISETLRQLMDRVSQAETRSRASRGALRVGEGVLDEVQDSLGRIAELAQESAGGGETGRAALQAQLEELREQIGRMLSRAAVGDTPLFLDEDIGLAAGAQALLPDLLPEGSAGQKVLAALPDWLRSGITHNALSAGQILAALGLDQTAGGLELLAALTGGALDQNSAAGYLATLYLGAVIAGNALSGDIDPERALEGLRQLLEEVAAGVPLDQAVSDLTGGTFLSLSDFEAQFTGGIAPGLQQFLIDLLLSGDGAPVLAGSSLLTLLAGVEGMNLDLMMGLLSAFPQPGDGPNPNPEPAAAAGPGQLSEAPAAPEGVSFLQLGAVQVIGRDLSGVSFDSSTGLLTVSGEADVVLRGTEQGEAAILITGSGPVTLQNVKAATVTVAAARAQILTAGESALDSLEVKEGASLTLGGSGLLKLGALRAGDGALPLRLTGGAVVLEQRPGEHSEPLTIPVVIAGPASLAAHAARVTNAGGEPLEPFDLLWKTLLPGWSGITALAVDGKQGRLSLTGGASPDPVRLWLAQWDPAQGHPIHSLVIRGKDEFGRPKARYAYLFWNRHTGAFEQLSMYPNPFTVTGGEEHRDWVYEEFSHTLRILSPQVTALSGGSGVDANRTPFSGRIALADGMGAVTLTLSGVVCRVSSGPAFRLGRENEVMLLLENGTGNLFESGAGCAGISLGDGTSLTIDCADSAAGEAPAGTLTAAGGAGGPGIGPDSGSSQDPAGRIQIRGGVVTATGTGGGAGIGGALGAPVGDISIRGGTITAAAACCAAAIGAGIQGQSGNILITGAATIVHASGGRPGGDIGACLFGSCGRVTVSGGAEIGSAKLWTQTGIPLHMGEDTVILPQFPLSSGALQLNRLSVSTQDNAQAAKSTIDSDRRWVAQIQAAYRALSKQLERSLSGLQSVQQYINATESLIRDAATAGTLLSGMRQSILRQASQAMGTHSRGGLEEVRQLLG